jgi:hypothetical protein
MASYTTFFPRWGDQTPVRQITVTQANRLIEATNGRYFSVLFRKKNGDLRRLTGRLGVRKGTTGEGLKFSPREKRLRVVSETVRAEEVDDGRQVTVVTQPRMIPTDARLYGLKTAGKVYEVLPDTVLS